MGKYVNCYNIYQRMKNRIEALTEKLMVNKVSKKSWIYLTVNFITKLSLVAEKNVILVVYDRLSKIAYFMTTIERISVEELMRLFRDNMWKLHELPKSIILNKRPQFTAELTKELNKILGIETKLLILFHSQTNGQTEPGVETIGPNGEWQ